MLSPALISKEAPEPALVVAASFLISTADVLTLISKLERSTTFSVVANEVMLKVATARAAADKTAANLSIFMIVFPPYTILILERLALKSKTISMQITLYTN